MIKNNQNIKSFFSTVKISTRQAMTGGPFKVFINKSFLLLWYIFMTAVWFSIGNNPDVYGMSLENLLTYSLLSAAFRQQLDIITPATSALWEGSIVGRYTRPMHVFSIFISETIGKYWVPIFCCFSLPMLVTMPIFFGFSIAPSSFINGILAFVSLCLSASLGFAMDFIFAGLAIRMKNGCWAATQIRESFMMLVSGALIPFSLLPKTLCTIFTFLPFGSIANTPLNIYIGSIEPFSYIILQITWNVIIWICAVKFYKKSEERMISFGG